MFSPITKSQIIGFSPNSCEVHAYTSLHQHNKTLFAFASDNLIFIYDRQTFKQAIIETPDPSSRIIGISFFGSDLDCTLICVNTKNILYSYLLTDLTKPIKSIQLPHKIIFIASSNLYIFFQTEHSIIVQPIDSLFHKQNSIHTDSFLLTYTNTHKRCLISPCGRALATFTRGGTNPVIYYAPFDKKRCAVLPIQGSIMDFQWGCSEHLIAVTANAQGTIRLWVESTTSYQLHCIKWFSFPTNCCILSTAICISTDVENRISNVVSSSKSSDRTFPGIRRHPVLILVVSDDKENNISLLQETAKPRLEKVASIGLKLDDAVVTICDMKRIFSNHLIKRLIFATRLSKNSLSFFHFELGEYSISNLNPFNVKFIRSPIIKIFNNKNSITLHDGFCYDWSHSKLLANDHSIIEVSTYQNGEITICEDCIDYCYFTEPSKERIVGSYNLNDTFLYATTYNFDKNMMIVLSNSDHVLALFFDGNSFVEIPVDCQSTQIRSTTIHSTDLFAICTSTSVDFYFFTSNRYEKFVTKQMNNPYAAFLPHPYIIIAISTGSSIQFFMVWRNQFILFKEMPMPNIKSLTLIGKNLLNAATDKMLICIKIEKNTFPIPPDIDSHFTLLTCFSLALFNPINDKLNNIRLTQSSFTTKMNAESFTFPKTYPDDLPDCIKNVVNDTPPNWGILDDEGQRFLFSWAIARDNPEVWKFIPLFGIWALLSRDQSSLVSSLRLSSVKSICDMLLPIWARDKTILTKAVNELVKHTVPNDNDVDTYLLLCVLIGQINIAKKISRIKGQTRLASFFSSPYLQPNQSQNDDVETSEKEKKKLYTRIEKSAYEAQKQHRYCLAAMFFILKNMYQQALYALQQRRMILILTLRLLDRNDWVSLITNHFGDDFYSKYWTEKMEYDKDESRKNTPFVPIKSIEILQKWSFEPSTLLSIEAHRYALLKRLNSLRSFDILGLQNIPALLKAEFLPQEELKTAKPSPKQIETEEKEKNTFRDISAGFDFYNGMDDNWEDDDIDYESSEDDDTNGNQQEKEEQIVVNRKIERIFDSNFDDQFFSSPFETFAFKRIRYNETSIVYLISSILNRTCNNETVKLIGRIADDLFEVPDKITIVISIIFTLAFSMSRPSMMLPIYQKPLNIDSIRFFIQQIRNGILTISNDSPPNILRHIVSDEVEITQSDRLLGNFIALHEFCTVLASLFKAWKKGKQDLTTTVSDPSTQKKKRNTVVVKIRDQVPIQSRISEEQTQLPMKNEMNKSTIYMNNKNSSFTVLDEIIDTSEFRDYCGHKIISYFHHLHRIYFEQLPSTSFTNPSFLEDLVAIGIGNPNLPEKMSISQIDKRWKMSVDNPFLSPFYIEDRFQASRSIEIPTSLDHGIIGVCINNDNTNIIAVCNSEKVEIIDIKNRKPISNDSNHDSIIKLPSTEFSFNSINSSASTSILNTMSTSTSYDKLISSHDESVFESNDDSSSSAHECLYTSMSFDSPFIAHNIFRHYEANKVNNFELFNPRKFSPVWNKDQTSFKDLKPTCIASHPRLPYFLVGSKSGRIYLSAYEKKNDSFTQKKSNAKKISSIKIPNNSSSTSSSISASPLYMNNSNDELNSPQMNSFSASPLSTMTSLQARGRGIAIGANPNAPSTSTLTYSTKNRSSTTTVFSTARAAAASKNKNPAIPIPRNGKKFSSVSVSSFHPHEMHTSNSVSVSFSSSKKALKLSTSTLSGISYCDNSVSSLSFSMTGDKLLTTNNNGYVFISDFSNTATLFVSSSGVAARWLNTDSQIILWEPMSESLLVYDINAGLSPVASFPLPNKKSSFRPIDIYGSHVITGYDDGTVLNIDLKNESIVKTIKAHDTPISTLKYDNSGRFYLTGSRENCIKVINSQIDAEPCVLPNVFSDYDEFHFYSDESLSDMDPTLFALSSLRKGILTTDISNNTIVSCGYSTNAHIWMVTDPSFLTV